MSVKTRFAPSPTGYLHVGGARTALYSWLYAKKTNGRFVLRIEDTDRERSTQESIDVIMQGMSWLGLDFDEGPFYQTQRFERYGELIQSLLDQDKAYYCYCSRDELDALRKQQMEQKIKPRYDGRCRHRQQPREGIDPVVRFRNPEHGEVVFEDLIRGTIAVSNQELDDLIIARSDGTPTYNFTVVVDDMDMNITHVIRGDDHINNTPRQINILRALGAELPNYAHVPMILGSDGARLSKRHGAVSVLQYREQGYLPKALLNYLVRLGWSHGDQEVFSIEEMTELFELSNVNRAASTFNSEKLLWLNHHYIKHDDPEQLANQLFWHFQKNEVDIESGPPLVDVVKVLRERSKTLVEMMEMSLFFYADFESYDEKAVKKQFKPEALEVLQALLEQFSAVEAWEGESLHHVVTGLAESMQKKMGEIAQPLRVAIAGRAVSPPIDATLELLGRQKTLQRLERAIKFIEQKNL
ncbi:MAG: glutamate--tRNA ligase [Gammaproteobacteria bacterium]|nr:glutamate--tRNA ligase [Gammaproteobacteria bacterium]